MSKVKGLTISTGSAADRADGGLTVDGSVNAPYLTKRGAAYTRDKVGGYMKFASVRLTSSSNSSAHDAGILLVVSSHYGYGDGICEISYRKNANSISAYSRLTYIKWICRSKDINPNDFILTWDILTGGTPGSISEVSCYVKQTSTWRNYRFTMIDEGTWDTKNNIWSILNAYGKATADDPDGTGNTWAEIPEDPTHQIVSVDDIYGPFLPLSGGTATGDIGARYLTSNGGVLTLWTTWTSGETTYSQDLTTQVLTNINVSAGTRCWCSYSYQSSGDGGIGGYMPMMLGHSAASYGGLYFTGTKEYSGAANANCWGIGTNNPLYKLHVVGSLGANIIYESGVSLEEKYLKTGGTAYNTARFGNVAFDTFVGTFVTSSGTAYNSARLGGVLASEYSRTDTKNTAGSTQKSGVTLYFVVASGQSAYTQTYSNVDVYIDASNYVHSAGFFENSDENLKDFGEDISVDFNRLRSLRKKYFTWKEETEKKRHLGVSAQEVSELYPELVSENKDGYLSVDYAKLSVIALAAIDKQQEKIDETMERLRKVEAELEELKTKIAK